MKRYKLEAGLGNYIIKDMGNFPFCCSDDGALRREAKSELRAEPHLKVYETKEEVTKEEVKTIEYKKVTIIDPKEGKRPEVKKQNLIIKSDEVHEDDPDYDELEYRVKNEDQIASYDFPITGWWKYNGAKDEMKFTSVKIGEKGRMKFVGTDSKGSFEMKGIFHHSKKVLLKKKYENEVITLKGEFDDSSITGKCKETNDDFQLVFNLPRKFGVDPNYIRLNEDVPLVGIINSPSRGWGFIFSQKQISDVKDNVKVLLVRGDEESIATELQADGTMIYMEVGGDGETYM